MLLLGAGVAIALPPRNSPPRVLPAPDPQLVYSVSGCEDVSLPPERVMAQNGAIAPPCAKITSANNWPTSDLAFLGRDPVRNVAIGFENDRLTFSHDLTFTCCASFVLDRSIDRSVYPPVISIVERDMGERCRCLCDFQVAGTIGPLPPGSYVVRVYGEFGDGKSRILLFERSASVPHGLLDPPATGSPQPARR
ncbi:MAG: hypothetical protein EA001_00770 [Oscillatoriales cyanobacterium]|nr:MAG: hypothetical protein EA001_00770 [Oscillatoriales cyanobacterium]